jgi:hypothetical protein
MVVAREVGEERVLVVGSSLALSDSFVRSFRYNRDMALEAVAWLTGNTRRLSLAPREEERHLVVLTSQQESYILAVVVILLPLVVVAAGLLVWWNRRH